jgi:hypothetical protein
MAKAKGVKRYIRTKPAAKAAGPLDVHAPEKRNTNFFARVKASNKEWVDGQAKKKGLNTSQYVDLLIENLKGGQQAHA